MSPSPTSRNTCPNRSFTLARKCVTGSLLSEGGIKRAVICLPTAFYRLNCLVFLSSMSDLRAMFFLSLSLQKIHTYLGYTTLNKTHLPHLFSDYLQFCLWGPHTLLLQCMSDPYLLLAYADVILFFVSELRATRANVSPDTLHRYLR